MDKYFAEIKNGSIELSDDLKKEGWEKLVVSNPSLDNEEVNSRIKLLILEKEKDGYEVKNTALENNTVLYYFKKN